MMTAIKITFVLLLLIPVAMLMRWFVGRLTAEVPRQVLAPEKEKLTRQEKAARKAADKQAKQAKKKAKKQGITIQPGGKATDGRPAGGAGEGQGPQSGGGSYSPRRPREVHRSERVPFAGAREPQVRPGSEYYHDNAVTRGSGSSASSTGSGSSASSAGSGSVSSSGSSGSVSSSGSSGSVSSSASSSGSGSVSSSGGDALPAKKTRARSEKQPTKRQLRKNRERARKRDRRRRAAEEAHK